MKNYSIHYKIRPQKYRQKLKKKPYENRQKDEKELENRTFIDVAATQESESGLSLCWEERIRSTQDL